MDALRRYARIAAIGYAIALAVFAAGLWGLHRYGYAWAAKLDHDSWAARGVDYLQRGNAQGARNEYRALLAIHPGSSTGWAGLIESCYLAADPSESVLDAAQQAREHLAEAHPTIGDLLYARVRLDTAPGYPYEKNDAIKEVERNIDSIEAKHPLPAEGWYLRAQIAYRNGLAHELVAALQQLSQAPIEGSSDIYLRQREKAKAVLNEAGNTSPSLTTKMKSRMVMGEWDDIHEDLMANETDHGTEAEYLRGIVQEVDGNIAEAERLYGKSMIANDSLFAGQIQAFERLRKQHGSETLNP